MVAEGIRKIALLWQLVKNGILIEGSVLFWDEPETNINPLHIPILVEMLLELQRNGVQIFISTHDYFLAKYFEVKRTESDTIRYHRCFVDLRPVGDTIHLRTAFVALLLQPQDGHSQPTSPSF